ncbi:MAG: alpha/beta hydrolase [Proteobacteria bacterium]|nr:alpha/beta hydrolase [Pseudomonadota bacterium]
MTSWLFLAVSVWGAWFTWNALWPMVAGARRSGVSFAAGWLTSELALHHVIWQAIATAVFGWTGAFAETPGQVGLAITLASWAGLGRVQWLASRAKPAVEDALKAALGARYRESIRPSLREKLSRGIEWRRVALPFPIRRREVEKIPDIPFARERGVDLSLDVYRPRVPLAPGESRPVLFQIHGGGWVIGDKREQALPLMYQLASRGWVCVSANYRLSPHATFPEHLIDCKRALVWIREHVAEYGGDRDFVVVTGGSAGGHLAAMVALTQNDPRYQPGFEDAETSVQGCVPFYGIYDMADRHGTYKHAGLLDVLSRQVLKGSPEEIPEAWEAASPLSQVHEDAPPLFAIHGDRDTLAPVGQARMFVAALGEKTREPLAYAEIPGAQHAFELFPSLRSVHVNDGVERFLAVIYSRYLDARDRTPVGGVGC